MKDGSFWWQRSSFNQVYPYMYPSSRLEAAKERIKARRRSFEQDVLSVAQASTSAENLVRNISRYVQGLFVHNPIFQPARSSRLYTVAARWGIDLEKTAIARLLLRSGLIGHKALIGELIDDPDLLVELGEARCGHCARVLASALEIAGLKSKPLQLQSHIVTEVFLDNKAYIIDADAFKNGIFIEMDGRLATEEDILKNPYVVDQFKHTGWMFRRDSIYGFNQTTQKPYSGYIDLYSPEIDGQISARYGCSEVLYPPGIPKWSSDSPEIGVKPKEKITLEYSCAYPERAIRFDIRCGRTSKGYHYDGLIMDNLARETSGEALQLETQDQHVELTLPEPGEYYVTVSSVPYYVEKYPSYVWWSDELKIRVTP